MPRIIHTADIHLGMQFKNFGRSGNRIRAYLKNCLRKIVDLTLENQAQCLLIAGDLFDSTRISSSTYRFVVSELGKLGDIPAVIIPGTHDPASKRIIWDSLKECEVPSNVHLVLKPEQNPLTLKELDTTFWVKPNQQSNSNQSPVPELADSSLSKYHVAIAHGSMVIPGVNPKDDHPIQAEELKDSNFNYIALGHWHSYKEVESGKAFYPGAPEIIRFGLKDAGHVLKVDINDDGIITEKIKVAETVWQDIELSTDVILSPGDIIKELEAYSGDSTVIRCRITGEQVPGTNFDTELIETELEDRYCFIRVEDLTESQNLEKLLNNHPSVTITGQFIEVVKEQLENTTPEMREVLNDALKLGTRLLTSKKADQL
ncbi:MAG: hypothetical protein GF307_13695 [candidate division Zixibacteria bacterium]|nr:hypothetical protein [candidate division Zixibacteria bacterium]